LSWLDFCIFRQPTHVSGVSSGPSSGGTTACIQKLVLIILFRRLSVVQSNEDDSHLKTIISTNSYIRLYLLMTGLDTPETCRGWRNILRISCASSWFFFTRFYSKCAQVGHRVLAQTNYEVNEIERGWYIQLHARDFTLPRGLIKIFALLGC